MTLGRLTRFWAAMTLVFALAVCLDMPAGAATLPDDETPILLLADTVTYDEELGVVVATGNVEVSQNNRVVLADSLTYTESTGVVTASGNVSVIEPTGEVMFADFVELTDDLREGAITGFRMLLADGSRLAANSAVRTEGNRTAMNRAVFSPCDLCEDDRMRSPLWQIKAVRVVHDQNTKRIEYQDAWLEIYGVPVFYTPYFSHPDPSVERQSGFLAPRFSASNNIGFAVQPSYYWSIAPNEDITFSPLFTTKASVVALAEYRRRFADGIVNVELSGTIADREDEVNGVDETEENVFRGHIDAFGRFDLTRHWRWGFDLQRATDDTYLRLYDLSTERSLTSRVFAEGFYGQNFAALNAYAFQGLREQDDNEETPIVAPWLEYHHVTQPGWAGSHFTFDTSLMSLNRIDGRDSTRLSFGGGWVLPFKGGIGDVYRFSASLRGDAYWYNDHDPDSDLFDPPEPTENGFDARVFPQLAFQWSLPMVRHVGDAHEVIEPIFALIAGTDGDNSGKFPNEDSVDFEFDETHLFDTDRFTGLDRVDGGQRVDYGVKWTSFEEGGSTLNVFLGQSIRLGGDNDFGNGTGLEDDFSDVVGRVQFTPWDELDLVYRFRADVSDFDFDRNEVGLVAGPDDFRLAASYAYIDGANSEFGDREELAGTLNLGLSDYWSSFLVTRYDLNDDTFRTYGGGLTYEDECLMVSFSAVHNRYRDDEVEPSTDFILTFGFKYLGEFGLPF